MPIQEQAFVDVRATLGLAGSTARISLNRAAIQRVESELAQSGGEAILYLSSGEYELHQMRTDYGAWQGDLVLGTRVTLWMDPDAKIILKSSRLVILGGLVAPMAQIFDERGSGMVLFGGEIKELFPEWWGATGNPLHDDSDAIQRAIDAGSARRSPQTPNPVHAGKLRRPIPVTLRQMYTVGRTVVMGRAVARAPEERVLTGFGVPSQVIGTLRGLKVGTSGHAAGLRALDWQTLEHRPEEEALDRALQSALLRLDLAYGSLVENLTLDANRETDYALLVNSGVTGVGGEQTHAITVRGCTFQGARKTQVQVGPPQVIGDAQTRALTVTTPGGRETLRIPAELVTIGGGDVPGFNFRNCVIECRPTPGLEPSRGVQFRTANGVALRVSDTSFRGTALCYIDIVAGMVLVEGCDFNNPMLPTGKQPIKEPTGPEGFDGPSGEDVYLGASGSLVRESLPMLGSGYVAMASCRSRSATMFGTPTPSRLGVNNGRPTRSNLILGCRHDPATTGHTTSVRWGRTAVGTVVHAGRHRVYGSDGTLCVVGSYLGGKMNVVTRAAQSVVLACRIGHTGNEPEIVAPASPGTRSMTTVVFGLQCVATLLVLLSGVGCHRDTATAPVDAGTDLGAAKKADVSLPNDTVLVGRTDTGARFDARARPDVVIADPPDSGTPRDVARIDVPSIDVPMPDVSLSDVVFDNARYIHPEWAMEDVVRRDIEVQPLPDAAFAGDFGPPRQMRASCPAVTDGDATIPAPRLIFPMSPMRATSQRPTLFWSLPAGVDGARIELCRDRCCTQRVATLDVTGASARPPEALPPGVVFWRARGRIGTRVGRETSFTWEFGVKHRDAPTDTAWGTIKDFNGDGYDDLFNAITGLSGPGQARVYWGDHDGLSGSRFQAIELAEGSLQVGACDFDGDGLADAVVSTGIDYYTAPDGSPVIGNTARVIYGGRDRVRLGSHPFRVGNRRFTADDFNGDGYCDAAFNEGGLPRSSQVRFIRSYIVYGGPTGLGSGGRQFVPDPLGERLRPGYGISGSAGDLSGDGYAELLVGDPSDPPSQGSVYVFTGSAQGINVVPARRIIPEPPVYSQGVSASFGVNLGQVGDVDGDRISDVVLVNGMRRSRYFFRGARDRFLVYAQDVRPPQEDQGYDLSSFGGNIYVSPDIDGDGRADPVLPCPWCSPEYRHEPEYGQGYVYLYRQSPGSWVEPAPALVFRGGDRPWDQDHTFGSSVAAGDYDGDGYDDLSIGDIESYEDWYRPRRGKIFLVFGGPDLTSLRRSMIWGESPFPSQDHGIGGRLAKTAQFQRSQDG